MTQAEADELKIEPVVGVTGYEALERHFKYGVDLLRSENADRIAKEIPEFAEALKEPGRKLGPKAVQARGALVRIWSDSLTDGADRCRRAVKQARGRLARADTLELGSELVAAASSSALLGLLLENDTDPRKHIIKIAAGVVTLGGTYLAVISRFLRRATGGGNLAEIYAKLLDLAADAEVTGADLRVWHVGGGQPPQKGDELGDKARKIAIDIEKVCGLVGVN